MNASIAALCALEENPRYMPEPPRAFHEHGGGLTEEVPLVTREFLLRCGTESLYLILQEMESSGRFDATTKEELADLIIEGAKDGPPAPTKGPSIPLNARQRRERRGMKRQFRELINAQKTHGTN